MWIEIPLQFNKTNTLFYGLWDAFFKTMMLQSFNIFCDEEMLITKPLFLYKFSFLDEAGLFC